MKEAFAEYPEIIFCDETANVNERNMPLQTVLCMDGEGETHIIALFIISSENFRVMTELFTIFKVENPTWNEIKTVIVDKHISNLITFSNVFPLAQILICIFHVYQIFDRQVTTEKRSITDVVRKQALKFLRKMIFCESEKEYLGLYDRLNEIASQELMEYFDANWHKIDTRKMWAGYFVNELLQLRNRSNARSDSTNQKLKTILVRHAPLHQFFADTLKVIESLGVERDHRSISQNERVSSTRPNEEQFECDYRRFLTNFANTTLREQIEKMQNVIFSRDDGEIAYIFMNETYIQITANDCTCAFFKTMGLPCTHILKFCFDHQHNWFDPNLCHRRWLKSKLRSLSYDSKGRLIVKDLK